jgi:hypothetical protein
VAIPFKGFEDGGDNSGISWLWWGMLLHERDDALDLGPKFFNGAVGHETVVQFVKFAVDVSDAHFGVRVLEMCDDLFDRTTADGAVFCGREYGKEDWRICSNPLANWRRMPVSTRTAVS